jgi:hypothetical protein
VNPSLGETLKQTGISSCPCCGSMKGRGSRLRRILRYLVRCAVISGKKGISVKQRDAECIYAQGGRTGPSREQVWGAECEKWRKRSGAALR